MDDVRGDGFAVEDFIDELRGGKRDVFWTDADGESRSAEYVIPNANNCANCHGDDVDGLQNFADSKDEFLARLEGETDDMPDFSKRFSWELLPNPSANCLPAVGWRSPSVSQDHRTIRQHRVRGGGRRSKHVPLPEKGGTSVTLC